MADISLITLSNNSKVTYDNILLCQEIYDDFDVRVIVDPEHITKNIQSAIDLCETDYVCIVHNDVRLLYGFERQLRQSINDLNNIGNWAFAGVAGANENGIVAHLVDRGNVLGSEIYEPFLVDTLDEVFILVNKKCNIRLDENIVTHHLWATDLCLQAKSMGYDNYVINAMLHHNSSNNYTLDSYYYTQARYIRDKWKEFLPFNTTCARFE